MFTTLLSYLRSGKNWLSYCINQLSGRIVDSFWQQKAESPIVRCTHYIHEVPKDQPLILIIRNYKECIKRHGASFPFGSHRSNSEYPEILQFFHNHTAKKLKEIYHNGSTTNYRVLST